MLVNGKLVEKFILAEERHGEQRQRAAMACCDLVVLRELRVDVKDGAL